MNVADNVTALERLRSGVISDGRIHKNASIEIGDLELDIEVRVGCNTGPRGIGQHCRDHVGCRGYIAHCCIHH